MIIVIITVIKKGLSNTSLIVIYLSGLVTFTSANAVTLFPFFDKL